MTAFAGFRSGTAVIRGSAARCSASTADVRFAADKTPYKTHIDFLFWIGEADAGSGPAGIMRITSSTVLLGAGRIRLRGQHLDRYRSAVTDPEHGP